MTSPQNNSRYILVSMQDIFHEHVCLIWKIKDWFSYLKKKKNKRKMQGHILSLEIYDQMITSFKL